MNLFFRKRIVRFIPLFILICFFMEIPVQASSGNYDYSHRKRRCQVKFVGVNGDPQVGLLVEIKQIRNDFEFGGTIRREALDTANDNYGRTFQNYFDVAVPENEMKWENVMKCPQKCAPDFSKADYIMDWCRKHDVRLHGRSLFSNEKEGNIPEWTRSLAAAAFKQAMQERIDSTMGHFKGKVARWDLIDAIRHCANDSLLTSNMLETKSGDTAIFKWIMEEARKKDSVPRFVVSDYGLITSASQTAADQFINKVKPLADKFDLIGAVGHFGATVNKSSYEPKINYLAGQLGKPVMLTDVDFSSDISQAPDKIEELMRTCFADTNVKGLCMGGWDGSDTPSGNLTSYFVDSSLSVETPVGKRWCDVRSEWKTDTIAYADDSGMVTFNGYQGQYHALISCEFDTFYVEPGEGMKKVVIVFQQGETTAVAVKHASAGPKTTEISVNGISIRLNLPARYTGRLFLTAYSLSGQLLSRSPINPAAGKNRLTLASPSCRVFRIETANREPLYMGKVTALRR